MGADRPPFGIASARLHAFGITRRELAWMHLTLWTAKHGKLRQAHRGLSGASTLWIVLSWVAGSVTEAGDSVRAQDRRIR